MEEFARHFGKAEVSNSALGPVYRWRLKRENNLDVHVIIDSPELPHQAHVIISDPCEHAVEGVRTMLLMRPEEVPEAIQAIEAQWKMPDCSSEARRNQLSRSR